MIQSVVRLVRPRSPYSSSNGPRVAGHDGAQNEHTAKQSVDGFLAEVRGLLEAPLQTDRLLAISSQLQAECKRRLAESDISMLPSYVHTLPTGHEQGDVLALDVGGSTLRIALIRLGGKTAPGSDALQIRRIRSFAIDEDTRRLPGQAFFDWIAGRIGDVLGEYNRINGTANARFPMGLAWSFPVEMTSPRTGKLRQMGKGFHAAQGLEGEDLSDLIMRSCERKGLNVHMRAIVNDGAGTLISQAYRDPTTRMSLILGTGTNAGVFLPTSALARAKYGSRPASWFDEAKHVLVNTELSMVGKHSLPVTRWDTELNAQHTLPDFQPLEYLITGRYLGEIVRLILVEAVQTVDLFGGRLPDPLRVPYALDARVLAAFERDTTPTLEQAQSAFARAYPCALTPRPAELHFIRHVARLVSRRAAAYLATALHALWMVRTEAEGLHPATAAPVTVACNGAIVEKYPAYRESCQRHLDDLCERSGASPAAVTLSLAHESSIFGAAVAVACMEADP